MTLRIKNETDYLTIDLRRFFMAGLAAKGASTDKFIRVIYGRGAAHHGYAHLGVQVGRQHIEANWIQISLPRDAAKLDLLKLAQVFEHEVDHNLGLQHGEMQDWWTLAPVWQEELVIRVSARVLVPPPPRLSVRAYREARARAMLAKWEKKQERVAKLIKKWKAKVRYYERTAAKAAGGKEPK